MEFVVTHRAGDMVVHDDPTLVDWVLESLLDELDEYDDPEHPDVAVSHGDWSLGIARGGAVTWQDVETGDAPRHLRSLPRAEVLRLARAVALGELAVLEAQPWLPGYPRSGGVAVREATPEDWPAIWEFWSRIVEEGETYAYPLGLSSEEARALWYQPPPGRTVVALAPDGAVAGSAKMGPNRPGRGAHVATASFMVSPAHRGAGVGRALGEHALDWARAAGYRAMQFNAVVETNATAVRLWASLGFEVVGTVPEAFDHPRHGYVGLHVMYRRL